MKCPNCDGRGGKAYDEYHGAFFSCPACYGTGKALPDDDWVGRNMRKPNRIIVAGSRSFDAYGLLDRKLSHLFQRLTPDDTAIISGTARGADSMAEHWAWQHRFEVLRFPAQWDVHGRRAGYIRNEQMLEVATGLVAFWDGQSRGTAHMIGIAREKDLRVVVVRY